MQSPSPAPNPPAPPFADPTALGLLSLALACGALLPLAFGTTHSPAAFETAAAFALLFGALGQLTSGLLNLRNGNLLGGTLFATFAFNWGINAWVLWGMARGRMPDPHVLLATEATSLLMFLPLTVAFGYHSKILFLFLLDIDVLYGLKLFAGFAGVGGLALPIAVCTLVLGALALYIALALLVNPTVGRAVFPIPGPAFGRAPAGADAPRATEPAALATTA